MHPVGDLKAKFAAAALKNISRDKQPHLLFEGVSHHSLHSRDKDKLDKNLDQREARRLRGFSRGSVNKLKDESITASLHTCTSPKTKGSMSPGTMTKSQHELGVGIFKQEPDMVSPPKAKLLGKVDRTSTSVNRSSVSGNPQTVITLSQLHSITNVNAKKKKKRDQEMISTTSNNSGNLNVASAVNNFLAAQAAAGTGL